MRVGEGVQERRLACVRVPGEGDRRLLGLVPACAHQAARALRALDAASQGGDAVARQTPVALDLRLTRASGTDAPAKALQVGPETAHAGEVVLQLRELDL